MCFSILIELNKKGTEDVSELSYPINKKIGKKE